MFSALKNAVSWLLFMAALQLFAIEGRAETEPTPQLSVERGLWVTVTADEAGLDPFLIRKAIHDELGVSVYAQDSPAVVGTLSVEALGPDELVMRYEGKDGRRHERTVTLPRDAERRLETVALVAGNLARDETGLLIAELRPPVGEELTPAPSAADSSQTETAKRDAQAEQDSRANAPPPDDLMPKAVPEPSKSKAAPDLVQRPVNLSLFHPLSRYPNSENLEVLAEFGVAYSDVGRVRGGAFTVFVSRVRYGFRGVQFASLVTLSEGESSGVSASGVYSQQRADLRGVLAAGVATHSKGLLVGSNWAGVAAWHQGFLRGFQMAGVLARADEVEGVQFAGAINLTRKVEGGMIAGATNVAAQGEGVMLSGGANIVRGPFTGGQISAVNLASRIRGLQLGVVNLAKRVEGVQLGVINLAEDVQGTSLGLLPIAKSGRQQLVVWSTPGSAPMNAALKLRVGPVYSLLGVGYRPRDSAAAEADANAESLILPTVAIGGHVELDPVFFDLDALYQSAHTGDTQGNQYNLISLRPQVGLNLSHWFAVFGGMAVESGPHEDSWNERLTLRGLFGVQVL